MFVVRAADAVATGLVSVGSHTHSHALLDRRRLPSRSRTRSLRGTHPGASRPACPPLRLPQGCPGRPPRTPCAPGSRLLALGGTRVNCYERPTSTGWRFAGAGQRRPVVLQAKACGWNGPRGNGPTTGQPLAVRRAHDMTDDLRVRRAVTADARAAGELHAEFYPGFLKTLGPRLPGPAVPPDDRLPARLRARCRGRRPGRSCGQRGRRRRPLLAVLRVARMAWLINRRERPHPPRSSSAPVPAR